MDEVVMLVGGPFDGLPWNVSREQRELTIKFDVGDGDPWPGSDKPTRKIDLASYRRHDETTFVYCATQTAMGETDVPFWEKQLDLEEEV